MLEQEIKESLIAGLSELKSDFNICLSDSQTEQLLAYLALLIKWNKAYNLTAIRDPLEMVSKHLLDSLVVLPALKESLNKNTPSTKNFSLADVGAGAGLPGIPLAIAEPDWNISLIESSSKKTAFMQQVKTELGLKNITVRTVRAEQEQKNYDAVISRAFASLEDMLKVTQSMCDEKTIVWAMKGKLPEGEIEQLPKLAKPYRVSALHKLQVPGIDAERHLLELIPA